MQNGYWKGYAAGALVMGLVCAIHNYFAIDKAYEKGLQEGERHGKVLGWCDAYGKFLDDNDVTKNNEGDP